MAKAGARPVVDIYSTFLQRSYDQIFQEVALQDLPVVFCIDRAGLVGADGPTHHGTLRHRLHADLPEHGRDGPRRREGHRARCSTSPSQHDSPASIRYPRANLETIEREVQPIELGQAEILEWETDGMLLACGDPGGHLPAGGRAAPRASTACGSAWSTPGSSSRWTGPTILKAIEECGFVLTVEEGCLAGGFGSAVLEAANDAGLHDRATSAGSACPTASSCTPSATSSSPRSASTSTASSRPPSSWPGRSGCPVVDLHPENEHDHDLLSTHNKPPRPTTAAARP